MTTHNGKTMRKILAENEPPTDSLQQPSSLLIHAQETVFSETQTPLPYVPGLASSPSVLFLPFPESKHLDINGTGFCRLSSHPTNSIKAVKEIRSTQQKNYT